MVREKDRSDEGKFIPLLTPTNFMLSTTKPILFHEQYRIRLLQNCTFYPPAIMSIQAESLFNVKGMVAVITGGGTASLTSP